MDALQFGRWFSGRRHAHGLASQRALVEAVERHPVLRDSAISADFVARLEAGVFVFPFRGNVRRRVLLLVRLLCSTDRELRSYLHAAGLTNLDRTESDEIEAFRQTLSGRDQPPLLLPRRPSRLVGRESELRDLSQALTSVDVALCCVTGMVGVGKTTLAFEAVHRLAEDAYTRAARFPDGIMSFSCTGLRGNSGLISLLDDICSALAAQASAKKQPSSRPAWPADHQRGSAANLFRADVAGHAELLVAQALERTRALLGAQRILLILDDVEHGFPLDRALDVLLAPVSMSPGGPQPGRVILITSRGVPVPRVPSYRVALHPLSQDAALALFVAVLGRALQADEVAEARALCEALGYLPLAIELAAVAVTVRHIPLPLLVTRLGEHPLDRLLDSDDELHVRIAAALGHVSEHARQRFALLPLLGTSSFGLEAAAAQELIPSASLPPTDILPAYAASIEHASLGALCQMPPHLTSGESRHVCTATASVGSAAVRTAADLGELVQHALLGVTSSRGRQLSRAPLRAQQCQSDTRRTPTRYVLHPLLRAYAQEQAHTILPQDAEAARRGTRHYAIDYAERHHGNLARLEAERGVLLGVLRVAAETQQYSDVLILATALAGIVGCNGPDPEGERALHCGAQAAHELHDRYALVGLLTRLGVVHFYRGAYATARRIWDDALAYADGLGKRAYTQLGARWTGFLAAELGEQDEALRLASAYIDACADTDVPSAYLGSLVSRTFQYRTMGQRDGALADMGACLKLIARETATQPCDATRIVELEVCTELARLNGDYAQATEHSAATLPLLDVTRDRFFVADALLDQAAFALEQGERTDAGTLAHDALEMATAAEIPAVRARAARILAHL